MENRRGNEIFLGVIGVATLLVAIIGATFAYFSASAQSGNEAITTESAELALGYDDDPSELSTDLIPAADNLALFAGTNADWIAKNEFTYTDEDGETQTYNGKGLCKDDYNNDICGIYTFTIGNPNYNTAMDIQAYITSTKNEFSNIYFAIYDEENTQVVAPTIFPETGETYGDDEGETALAGLTQKLYGSAKDVGEDGNPIASFDPLKPTTYTRVDANGNTIDEDVKIAANRRTYKMVIWVHEMGTDQTDDDSGKILTASIRIETTAGEGVTGVIAAADAA